jgi:hypothetical protein
VVLKELEGLGRVNELMRYFEFGRVTGLLIGNSTLSVEIALKIEIKDWFN